MTLVTQGGRMKHDERVGENINLMNEAKNIMGDAVLLIRKTDVFNPHKHQRAKTSIDEAIAKLQQAKQKLDAVKPCSCCGSKV